MLYEISSPNWDRLAELWERLGIHTLIHTSWWTRQPKGSWLGFRFFLNFLGCKRTKKWIIRFSCFSTLVQISRAVRDRHCLHIRAALKKWTVVIVNSGICLAQGPWHTCSKAMMAAINFAPSSMLPGQLRALRRITTGCCCCGCFLKSVLFPFLGEHWQAFSCTGCWLVSHLGKVPDQMILPTKCFLWKAAVELVWRHSPTNPNKMLKTRCCNRSAESFVRCLKLTCAGLGCNRWRATEMIPCGPELSMGCLSFAGDLWFF